MTRLADLPPHLRAVARARLDAPRPTRARSATTRPAPDTTALGVSFATLCVGIGLPAPVAEYPVTPSRAWKMDYAWPAHRVALEVEGWGHRTKARYLADLEKYNTVAVLGWRLLRCTPATLATAATLELLRSALTPTETP